MIVDIRQDLPDFLTYIRERVAEHVTGSEHNTKPELVTRIDFGFEFGQGNELWLVFDTRLDAEPDGEWTQRLDEIRELKRPDWPIWHELSDDEVVYFMDLKGEKVNVMDNPDEQICEIVGDAMKHALLTARDEGAFNSLPRADRCELGIENMEGFYGWPIYEDRGKENLV